MKHVQIVAFCDGDHADGEQVPATRERTVTLDRNKPIVLDLCDSCNEVFFVNMLEVLLSRGSLAEDQPKPVRRRSGEGKSTTCPDCGLVSTSREALGQHTRKQHGKKLGEYDWPDEKAS